MSHIDFKTFSLVIIAGIDLLLAGFIFAKNRASESHKVFVTMMLFLAAWTLTNYGYRIAASDAVAYWWAVVSYGTVIGICCSFLHFSWVFPDSESHTVSLRWKYAAWISAAAVSLSAFIPNFVVAGIDRTPAGGIATHAGIYLIAAYILTVFVGGFLVFSSRKRTASGQALAQVSYILAGAVLSVVFGATFNLILPLLGNYSLVWLGPVATLIFSIFTFVTILAHQLFDIKVIIRRTILFTGMLVIVIAVYGTAIVLLTALFGNHNGLQPRFLAANIVACFLISLGYEPINKWLQNAVDRYLFRRDWERQKLLRGIGHALNDVLGLDEALEIVMQGMIKIFGLSHAVTYVFQTADGQLTVKRARQIGYPSSAKLALDGSDFVTPFFAKRDSIMLVEDLAGEVGAQEPRVAGRRADGGQVREHAVRSAVLTRLHELEIAMVIPLRMKNQAIGMIALGPKADGNPFDSEDLGMADLIASQVISSIEKARLYEADQMKSEFVSIASHELLTPISAMEGYLSMILDEGMGKVDDKSRGYLDNVYSSAKRLSSLVKDMLAASKLEAGQMKIVPVKMDVTQAIKASLKPLQAMAKEKSLTLTFEEPPETLPPVWADADRLPQVISNLIGNSIKYTFSGGITVRAVSLLGEGLVRIDVADTGIGMPKEQQGHLFEKFYRVYSIDTADVPGTGLGLYITKALVEKMGGSISVVSEPKAGSTFSFTLPIYKVE